MCVSSNVCDCPSITDILWISNAVGNVAFVIYFGRFPRLWLLWHDRAFITPIHCALGVDTMKSRTTQSLNNFSQASAGILWWNNQRCRDRCTIIRITEWKNIKYEFRYKNHGRKMSPWPTFPRNYKKQRKWLFFISLQVSSLLLEE